MKNFASKRGFSFLEMIVVVAIITIMTMVMFVISFKDRSKKEIEAVAREVTAAVRETQNNALTGRQQGGENLPCGFIFEVLGDGSRYEVRGSYRNLTTICNDDYSTGSYTEIMLKDNVDIHDIVIESEDSNKSSTDAPSNYVAFMVPYGTFIDQHSTEDTDPSIGMEFVVTKKSDPRRFHICVHATGLIEEVGFNDEKWVCAFN